MVKFICKFCKTNITTKKDSYCYVCEKNILEIAREKQQKNIKELKQIPFNCWIIAERQQEKIFLEQQNNKNFLAEQFKSDLNDILQEE